MMTLPAIVLVIGALGPVSPGITAEITSDSPESVAAQAFDDWQDALGVRRSCSSGVSITFEALPTRRGEYRVGTQQVVIDPNDPIEGMYGIVLHELSHHTFLGCGAFADTTLTAAFYRDQGLPDDRDWFDYSAGWAHTPAEHFAEAMAAAVAGSGEGGITINPDTIGLVLDWLAGRADLPSDSTERDPEPYTDETKDSDGSDVASTLAEPANEPETLEAEASRREIRRPASQGHFGPRPLRVIYATNARGPV
jgi:hypothetical protein